MSIFHPPKGDLSLGRRNPLPCRRRGFFIEYAGVHRGNFCGFLSILYDFSQTCAFWLCAGMNPPPYRRYANSSPLCRSKSHKKPHGGQLRRAGAMLLPVWRSTMRLAGRGTASVRRGGRRLPLWRGWSRQRRAFRCTGRWRRWRCPCSGGRSRR